MNEFHLVFIYCSVRAQAMVILVANARTFGLHRVSKYTPGESSIISIIQKPVHIVLIIKLFFIVIHVNVFALFLLPFSF